MGEIPDAKLQIQYLALNKKQNKTLSETKMNNTLIIDLDVKYKQKKKLHFQSLAFLYVI